METAAESVFSKFRNQSIELKRHVELWVHARTRCFLYIGRQPLKCVLSNSTVRSGREFGRIKIYFETLVTVRTQKIFLFVFFLSSNPNRSCLGRIRKTQKHLFETVDGLKLRHECRRRSLNAFDRCARILVAPLAFNNRYCFYWNERCMLQYWSPCVLKTFYYYLFVYVLRDLINSNVIHPACGVLLFQ